LALAFDLPPGTALSLCGFGGFLASFGANGLQKQIGEETMKRER